MIGDKIYRLLGLYPKQWPKTVAECEAAIERYDRRAGEIRLIITVAVVVALLALM